MNRKAIVTDRWYKEATIHGTSATNGKRRSAAERWGGDVIRMKVPEAQSGSWEDCMHEAGAYDKLMLFNRNAGHFLEPIGHRAIGVVYHPLSPLRTSEEINHALPSV